MGTSTAEVDPGFALSDAADQQHLAWVARSFGRADYAPLSTTDLEVLVSSADVVSKYPGTHLFREGEQPVAVYLIESGEVEVYRGTEGVRRVVTHAGPGTFLGDVALFAGRPHISSAQAVSRVRVYRFDRDRLLADLARHPSISMRWLVAGLRRMEQTQQRVIRLMHKTVLGQVADLLGEEADPRGDVHLSQTTIATLLGVTRQSVNEALGRLRDQNLVETGYRQIRVLDQARLSRISNS
ncbi:MAG: Crp/Fnr family transcriptional regulator [Acidimicrobiia bacterium]